VSSLLLTLSTVLTPTGNAQQFDELDLMPAPDSFQSLSAASLSNNYMEHEPLGELGIEK